jgi:hypothetical protein
VDAHAEKILELVFQGGVALAGLILVFLGFVFTAFDAYDEEQKKSVRKKYHARATQSLIGFVAALLSAILSLAAYWEGSSIGLYYSAVAALALSFGMVGWVAIVAVVQMG